LRQIQSQGFETKGSILKIPKAWAFQAGINEDEFKKIIGSINHLCSHQIMAYLNRYLEDKVKSERYRYLEDGIKSERLFGSLSGLKAPGSSYSLTEKGLEKQDLENYFLLEIQTENLTEKLLAIKGRSTKDNPANHKQIGNLVLVDLRSESYKIVINDQYLKSISVTRHPDKTWDLLFRLAEGEKIAYTQGHKSAIDFLNSNKECKLYSNTGCKLTEIFGRENGQLVLRVSHDIISPKAFETRKNKSA
jgi:hypothetical protein